MGCGFFQAIVAGWTQQHLKALIETRNTRSERVFLVGVELKASDAAEVRETLAELGELAATAGAEIVGEGTQKVESPSPATYIGKGKADEYAGFCRQNNVDTVIFDDELSPAQSRNLEKIFECKILDRTALILDIFAQRARTREGKLQIELAQLQHLLPRLTRFWGHLSRQSGGIGMRGGEGESQLEADRRKVSERIDRIERDLDSVRRQRETQRAGRQRSNWPLASIVGYTNAGKSTLLNQLTGAQVLAMDKLFATLEEVVQADLLLHVVDVSHPLAEEQVLAVNAVLTEIGAVGKPTIMVFNKVDRLADGVPAGLREHFPHSVAISARTGDGVPQLLAELGTQLRPIRAVLELRVPQEQAAVIARIHAVGQVVESRYGGKNARFKVRIPPHLQEEFLPFMVA